jgi:hypothetical protein
VQGRTEEQVVDLGELVVDVLDERVLDGRDRECPCRRIASDVVGIGLPIE